MKRNAPGSDQVPQSRVWHERKSIARKYEDSDHRRQLGMPLAHTPRGTAGVHARTVVIPTDRPPVGALNGENFAASALTPSMDRPQVLILGQHPNLVRPVRPVLQDY